MSALRRMMTYLGLGIDDEYDEYEGYEEQQDTAPGRVARQGVGDPGGEPTSAIRTLPRDDVSGIGSGMSTGIGVPRASSVVRPLTPVASSKPVTVTPASFQDAKEIGDRLKAGVPVIVAMQGADRDLMRRIIDFASGVTYGLDGEMERTADRVYLLTPTQRG